MVTWRTTWQKEFRISNRKSAQQDDLFLLFEVLMYPVIIHILNKTIPAHFVTFPFQRPKRKEARKVTYTMHSGFANYLVNGYSTLVLAISWSTAILNLSKIVIKKMFTIKIQDGHTDDVNWLQSVSVSNYQLSQSLTPQVPNSDEKRSFLCKNKVSNANAHICTVFR